MGRGDSSGDVLHLGPVPAFKSVGNWCYLRLKSYWLAISDQKEVNFLREMLGFLLNVT